MLFDLCCIVLVLLRSLDQFSQTVGEKGTDPGEQEPNTQYKKTSQNEQEIGFG